MIVAGAARSAASKEDIPCLGVVGRLEPICITVADLGTAGRAEHHLQAIDLFVIALDKLRAVQRGAAEIISRLDAVESIRHEAVCGDLQIINVNDLLRCSCLQAGAQNRSTAARSQYPSDKLHWHSLLLRLNVPIVKHCYLFVNHFVSIL